MSDPDTMPSSSQHTLLRHPGIAWAELRVSMNTDACYRAHSHAEYSLGIVDSGRAVFHHPDGPQQVQAGSVVLIEPDVIHSCNPLPGQVWSYRMLFINAQWLHEALAREWGHATPAAGLAFASRSIDAPATAQCVGQLCHAFASAAVAGTWGTQLAQWFAGQARACGARGLGHAPAELVPALVTLHAGCGGRVTVGDLADACGLSHSQFIRRFRAAWGTTPGAYLQNLRVNGARRLLAQGVALADAAHAMGFADQAHLQRAFKAHHAMTPGDYRNTTKRSCPGS